MLRRIELDVNGDDTSDTLTIVYDNALSESPGSTSPTESQFRLQSMAMLDKFAYSQINTSDM